jgi:NAD(P)-dependent dehydrogenase (short-subunit alcohol dehydrogenase family)
MMLAIPICPEYLAQSPNLPVLASKNVLITGGASGLGAAITKKFAENGAHITIADIQAEKGESCAGELPAHGLP